MKILLFFLALFLVNCASMKIANTTPIKKHKIWKDDCVKIYKEGDHLILQAPDEWEWNKKPVRPPYRTYERIYE